MLGRHNGICIAVVREVSKHPPVHRLDYRRTGVRAMLGVIKEGFVGKFELELSLSRWIIVN